MPARVVAVLSADWHLDRRPWARHPTAEGDSLYALKQIVDLAVQYDAEIVAAGDLYNATDPDSYVVSQSLAVLSYAPRGILYVQGQHERCDPPWLSLCPKAQHLHRHHAIIHATGGHGNIHLYGLDYCASLKETLAAQPLPQHIDLLVTHQVWKELMHKSAGSTASVRDLPRHVSKVFTGDFHQHLAESYERGIGEPPVTLWSPGSTHCRSTNEPTEKYVYLLRGDMTIESVPLDCRPVRSWSVPSVAALDALISTPNETLFGKVSPQRPPSVTAPVVSIAVTPDVPAAEAVLNQRFADCHVFVHLADRSDVGNDERSIVTVTDTATAVYECLDEMPLDPDVRSDARDLLRSPDPSAALDTICRRFSSPVEKGSTPS